MKITGDITSISEALLHLQNYPKQGVYHLSLSIELGEPDTVLIEKNTLKPIEDINSDSDCFIIQKEIYDHISAALQTRKSETDLFKKTEAAFQETRANFTETDAEIEDSKNKIPEANQGQGSLRFKTVSQNKSNKKNQNRYGDSDLYVIEEHEFDCRSDNRPTVFAIKKLGDNYYNLYYRKSVYDIGNDTAFRKFLSVQPGTLAAYRYCKSVNSIREEFHRLGLSLRHNGKNELSKQQADEFLYSFHTLRFL